MGLGLKRAGFKSILAFDINAKAVETHSLNIKSNAVVADVTHLPFRSLKATIKDYKELDLFAGGPPCQGFSKQKRNAHRGDSRNDLVLKYIEFVKELQPRSFLFENVAIFGQKRGVHYIQKMTKELQEYDMYPHFYNCADYGLAQTRERFILVGIKKDLGVKFTIPAPTVKKWKTVGQELAGIPEPPKNYKDHPDFPNHQRARVSDINIERFSYVPQGGGWKDIPFEMRLPCHQKADTSKGGWPDVYGRLKWEGQCPTITGGFDSFSRGRYGHPLHNRPITPREAAKLQGFPNSFVFIGNRGDIRAQIGNAVPPPISESIGLEITKCLLTADGLLEKSETE